MHKLSAALLSLLLILALPGCGGGGASSANGSDGETAVSLSGEITGEITVSTYDTMQYKAFLEDAARLFEEKYPGTTVNVETFSAMPEVKTSEQGNQRIMMVQQEDDPQGRQDYINKVNTSLMSGKGADVLAMDVLPVHKYADSGQLENLAAYMEADPDFHRADYRQNILDAVEYQNGTWFLPMDYTFNYYAYDSTLLTGEAASGFGTGSAFTIEELIALAGSAFDGSAKLFTSPDYIRARRAGTGSIWDGLLTENYTSFVDVESKAANFDDGSFTALLEAVKQYSEQGYIPQGATGQRDAEAMMQRAEGGPGSSGGPPAPTDRYFYKSKNIFSLISQFSRNTGVRMNIMIGSTAAAVEEDDEIAGIRANADGSVPFTYEQAYGINANSANKETAWAFIKFLLGEEMQLNTNLSPTALPLLNTARAKKMETVMSGAVGRRLAPAAQEEAPQAQVLDATQQEILARYNEAVEQLSDRINTYIFEDTTVNDMIAAEVGYFFDGTKTAEEVAGALQSKVGLYLNE